MLKDNIVWYFTHYKKSAIRLAKVFLYSFKFIIEEAILYGTSFWRVDFLPVDQNQLSFPTNLSKFTRLGYNLRRLKFAKLSIDVAVLL